MRFALSAVSLLVLALTTVIAASLPSKSWARAGDDEAETRAERAKKQIEMQAALAHIGGMKTVVDHLAKMSLACETSADCAALPMGKRACGGPNSFVVTSKANPSLTALVESIQLVTKAEAEANKKFGLVSICSIAMPPAVDCLKAPGEAQASCQ